jgi:hypothetical protein
MITLSGIAAVLKKVIVPELQSEMAKSSVLFDKVQKNVGITIANNYIYIASRVGRHSGIYYVAEGSNPLTGNAKYGNPYTSMKYGFGTVEFTDQALEAAKKGDAKAIASILSTEINALKDDMKVDANRIMHGAGAGKLCQSNGTGANSTTLLVDGNPNGGEGNEYLAEGMYIVVGTSSSSQISALVGSTGATLATAITWGDGAVITKYGADEPMGLAGIIDDGDNAATIQNITRASNSWANAQTYDTEATLTEANMIDVYLRTRRYGGTDVILMGKTLYAKYGALLLSYKKSADTKEILTGGWKGLDFMDGCGVLLDFDTWDGYIQFINFAGLTRAEMSAPFDWLEADAYGGILKRSPTVRTNWEGTMKYYFNLVGLKFRSQGRMKGQTV